jgi:hypothetical protein
MSPIATPTSTSEENRAAAEPIGNGRGRQS